MAKNIRWQIPFVSLSGTHYRIDIYDEQDGSWSGITELTAGDTPFTTEEDASDDFFAPIRTQTGTLQVCTLLPGTTDQYITLDELLPANNIARPVRLINLDTSHSTIEWQGFLSCEAYNQDYIGTPQILDIPVISVLEAMDSVPLNQLRSHGLVRVMEALKLAMDEMMLQSGMNFYTYVNHSTTSYQILNKYIDQTIFFEQNEYNNENSTTYIVSGLSAKKAIEIVAKYMGWVVREQGTKIYFERLGEDLSTQEVAYSTFGSMMAVPETVDFTTKDLATDVAWRGTGHQRSVEQGAKSVEVVANLEKYNVDMELPAFPYGNTETFYRSISYTEWLYIVANKNASAYSNLTYRYFKGTVNIPLNVQTYDGEMTLQDVFASMIAVDPEIMDINIGIVASPPNQAEVTAGAFLAQVAYETQQQSGHSTSNGLYIVWLPQAWDTSSHYNPDTGYYVNTDVFENLDAIFTIQNPIGVFLRNGYLKLSASMKHLIYEYENYEDYGSIYSDSSDWEDNLLFHIKIGDKYWTGSEWSTTPSKVWINIKGSNFEKNWTPTDKVKETDGYLIPITDTLSGAVEIGIYAPIHATAHGFKLLAETFFSDLKLEYLELSNAQLTDRGENHYFRLLGTNFRDEISVSTDLASMLNNLPSPSLVMDNSTTPMKTIDYLIHGGTDARRPEVDLLNRLATYYGAARQRLELEVAHPTAAPLPLLKLNGINDGKVYLPLSESRDWQTDVCKLTCFEMPQEPSES